MRVAVIGGNGHIGSCLCHQLIEGDMASFASAEVYEASVRNRNFGRKLSSTNSIGMSWNPRGDLARSRLETTEFAS
jgi:nucleoside-diphosphate-sugar epimerase